MKPEEEQIKEFWEWCGAKHNRFFNAYSFPDGAVYTIDTLTDFANPVILGLLFKYAVPLVHNKLGDEALYDLMVMWVRDTIFGKDSARTLFRALQKVIDGNNTPAEH